MSDLEYIKVKGVQDELHVYESKVVIVPKGVLGFFNKGFKGEKEILFSTITAVQFKEAGAFVNGYIQFTMAGGNESKGGILGAVSDENTFLFAKASNDEMKKVKSFMDGRVGQKNEGGSSSVADEISKLNDLLNSGAISESEYTQMKTSLIKKAS